MVNPQFPIWILLLACNFLMVETERKVKRGLYSILSYYSAKFPVIYQGIMPILRSSMLSKWSRKNIFFYLAHIKLACIFLLNNLQRFVYQMENTWRQSLPLAV